MAKIHEEMSELLDKQVNVQKESLKKLPGFTQAPASSRKKCAMKMKERNKEEKKNDCRVKKILWKEGFYKAVSEDWLNGFRRTSGY